MSSDNRLRVDLIYARDLLQQENPPSPVDPEYQWHFLAEGDSWFTIGAIPSSNLLFELRLAKWTSVLTLAYPGDTMVHMGQLADNPDLHKYLGMRRFNYPFHAMLMSGGGNDVIDAAKRFIRPQAAPAGATKPQDYIDEAAFQSVLDTIVQGYRGIVAERDCDESQSRGVPIIVHTYDYPTPRNAPSSFVGAVPLLGPWLYPVFKGSGIDMVMQRRIVTHVIDTLAATLMSLDVRHGGLPAFYVVDTRDTLVPANPSDIGNSNDWLNEIHPNHDGYRKIAEKLSAGINGVMAMQGL